ncbi:MAG: ion channel [Ignavibacteria bacterium]|nr:ion channel [Ignavibacteria bacterium]
MKKNEIEDTGLSSKFQTRTQRLIGRDGSFNVKKTGIGRFESFNLYHYLINISWTRFFILALLFYIVINLAFTVFYVIAGPEHLGIEKNLGSLHSFMNSFFFSAQTLTTVGFGRVNPQNAWTNIIATLEAGIGLMVFAVATGLLYGRFSRPATNMMFSRSAIFAKWGDNQRAFQFRVANAFTTEMMDAEIQVIASWLEPGEDGNEIRKFYALKLEYAKIVFFPTVWTVNHVIDENSPLFGKTLDDMIKDEAEFLILFKAYDDTFTQTVHARFSYRHDELVWGAKFKRVILIDEKGKSFVSLDKMSELEKVEI